MTERTTEAGTQWQAACEAFDEISTQVGKEDESVSLKENKHRTRRIILWDKGRAGLKITNYRTDDIQVWLNVFDEWEKLEEFDYWKVSGLTPSGDAEVRVWQAYALACRFSLKPVVNK